MSEKGVVRRLAALLVADAVGYGGLMQEDETATHQQVTADLDTLFAPKIREHRGRVVKTTGDGLLAEFSSIVDCVQCAIEMQGAVATEEPAVSDKGRLSYRIGVNVGDIIVERNDVFGDSVNLAMRLQGLAEPGGILLSSDAYRQVKGKLRVSFEDLGDHAVKSFRDPVRVYRVVTTRSPVAQPSQTAAGSSSATTVAVPSIAVLPFDNISGDVDQGYFSDGITNDIITGLSKFSELFVIASHTVFAYKGQSVTIRDVGRALGVRYVVEGSVQRGGSQIRVNVQLIDAASGHHLWGERYDRPIQDFLILQDEIVETIVGTLVARVDFSEGRRAASKSTGSLEAYDLYLRGRAAWVDWTEESNLQAQECFAKAIRLDPGFALAYGYLSYTLVQEWLSGWSQSPHTLRRARDLAQRCVTLGPTSFENYWSLGFVCLYSHEFDRAMAAFERAVELNPNSPDLLIDMADALIFVGRPEEAVVKVERAMRLNPIYPDSYLWTLGMAHYHAGRYEASLGALTRIAQPPNPARRHLAAALVRLGRVDEARQVAAALMKNDPEYTLGRERLWPYKDSQVLEAFVADLRRAGLPDGPGDNGAKAGAV